ADCGSRRCIGSLDAIYLLRCCSGAPMRRFDASFNTEHRRRPAMPNSDPRPPLTIRMHDRDNVAIVANDGGLPAGTVFPSGLTLREHVQQGHKVALVDLPDDGAVLRYNVPIGFAIRDIPAGSWVH